MVQTPTDTAQAINSNDLAALYDRDYLAWIETTLQHLQRQEYNSVDWNNLIEEIADMGRSEKRSLKSNLTVVLIHLLKWQYQPECRSNSWKHSIFEHRDRVEDNLKESPSLNPFIEKEFLNIYRKAIRLAASETNLPVETFPKDCPYTIAQVRDDTFLPK